MKVASEIVKSKIREMDDNDLLNRWQQGDFSAESIPVAESEILRRGLSIDSVAWEANRYATEAALENWRDDKDYRFIKQLMYAAAACAFLPHVVRGKTGYEYAALTLMAGIFIASAEYGPSFLIRKVRNRIARYLIAIAYFLSISLLALGMGTYLSAQHGQA